MQINIYFTNYKINTNAIILLIHLYNNKSSNY